MLDVIEGQDIDDVIHHIMLGSVGDMPCRPQPCTVGQVLPHRQVLMHHILLQQGANLHFMIMDDHDTINVTNEPCLWV